MAMSFARGMMSGLVVSAAALSVASVNLPRIEMPDVAAPVAMPEPVKTPAPAETAPRVPAALEAEAPEAAPVVPEAAAPVPAVPPTGVESAAPTQPTAPQTERRVIMEAPERTEPRPAPGAAPGAPAPEETAPAVQGSAARPEAPGAAPAMSAPEPATAPAVGVSEAPAPEQAAAPEALPAPYQASEPPLPVPEPVEERAPAEVTIRSGTGATVPGVVIKRGGATVVEEGATAAPAPAPALQRFAAPAVATEGKPRMAILLIDDGSSSIGAAALDSFPHPVTFAVPLSRADAGAVMAAYRAQGKEVVALADMPEGAAASDVEVSLSAALDAAPESVAVMEQTPGALQSSREVSEQVAAVLHERGVGLILHPQGLNTGVAIAAKADVPAQAIFRDFDSNDQSATVIRRFLDQAAFKAGQEGDVLMLGRLRADTISALLLWALQDRASRVALVPVSQVLLDTTGPEGDTGSEGEIKIEPAPTE